MIFVPGGLNSPGVVSDSVGLSGTTVEVGWEVSPEQLFGEYHQGNIRISNSLRSFEPSAPLGSETSFPFWVPTRM